ncbi:uncharacterized protein PV07_04827 [Cladophialophora immunda]|uniref:Zn(2)-C6 fungal-type domain-containing protein n=1 Tax=Cladophialophora immunda TaxID=569365 RepID=A0A0D1ZM11_9EURO|nr:uncharacterized protein PV07_04827 [Cladophialophora immunda]KIW28976.1 hypothetical protein PV07_04827 [Cladophialophora immunda]
MVGVAGKSKGCNTCRKRKIHCDGTRPSCDRCRKSDRVCGGYQRERHFKNLSALDRDTLLTRTQPLTSLTDLHTINAGSVFDPTPCSTPETDDTTTSKSQNVQGPRQAPSLSELFVDFLDNYIPRGEAVLQDGRKGQVSWLQAIDPSLVNDASLDLAIFALSLVCLGRKHGDESLRREGAATYGRALHRLRDILSHHRLLFEEQTLASCMALSTFELLEVSGDSIDGWVSHVEGMARLIQLRGPESHVVGLSHRLFLGFRSTCITYALATRQSTYLAQQDWLTVPWETQPKSDLDRLLDIMAQIAVLIEKAARPNTASSAFDIPHAQRLGLLQQGWEFHSQLESWYQTLLLNQAGPPYCERPSSTRFLPRLASVFPKALHFQNFEIARLHLSYWTTLLLLHSSILTTPFSSPSDVDPTSSLPASGENDFIHRRALELARMIARSMEYLLSEDMHVLGPQKVFFALRAAMHVLASLGEEEEIDWCKEVFEELDRRGYPFGKILAKCEWDDIPALLSGKSTTGKAVPSQNSCTQNV